MDHALARGIFAEIQARPYGLSLVSGEKSNNCYYKGIELLQRLGTLGYTVRGRVGEAFWDTALVPAEIMKLLPPDIEVTHFYIEVLLEDGWRPLDPSFQPQLANHGFKIGSWDSGTICFPITKLYSQEESIAYQQKWFDPKLQADFFKRGGPCWRILNDWFKEIGN